MRPLGKPLTRNEIANIREDYLIYGIETGEEPDLKEFADENDLTLAQLKKLIKDYSWDYHREQKKNQFNNLLAEKREIALEKAAVDIVETQTRFLRQAVDMVSEELPAVLAQMKEDRENGYLKPKEAVAYMKLLVEMQFKLMDKMEDARKEAGTEETDLSRVNKVFENPTMVGELVEATSDMPNNVMDNPDWDEAMENMGREPLVEDENDDS